MEFGAVFNLPFHSMPTIQSQEMLCQGTKGEKIKMYQSRNYKSVDLFFFFKNTHIESSSLLDNQFYQDYGGLLRVLKYVCSCLFYNSTILTGRI